MLYLYLNWYICYILVDQSLSQFSNPWTAAGQASLSFTISWSLLTSICPSSRWCHPTISSSVVPFSCSQSFLVSGSLLMSRLFTSGGQSLGASASASVLLMNIQGWFPLGLTGLISLLSRDSQESSPAPKFESINSYLWSNCHIHTWLLEKP